MVRPNKEGLDYFPLDTDMDTDDKIVLIEGRYGIEGYGTVVKLLSKIYKEGYYYKWTEKELLLFSQRTRIEEPFIKKVVDDCLKWDIFNKKLYKKYEILTSNGIQKRYFEAVKRRLKINVCMEYTIKGVLDNINKDNVNIYSINDDISTQSKEEKRKEYNASSKLEAKITFNFDIKKWENIKKEDMEFWKDTYPACNIDIELKKMSGWLIGNPKKKKSNYMKFINTWLTTAQDKGGNISSNKPKSGSIYENISKTNN